MGQPIDLIVGLGNPDPEYLVTRHNAGFWFVDALAAAQHATFNRNKKLDGDVADIDVAGRRIRLLKPMTYMNESGRSVTKALQFFKLEARNTLVVYDEIDLPPGRAKLKFGGGHAGHNGVRDVIAHIGADFWRIRIGVGHPGKREQVKGHVLRRAPADVEAEILDSIGRAIDVLPVLIEQGGEIAQTRLHAPQE
ncbi:MAG: aminoacyl-tRNA hydrolase [Gammaproteobacteria bacterium]|nr:aminoacyl-tRNA hydrolase [Gammaproteobacteria bacterium]